MAEESQHYLVVVGNKGMGGAAGRVLGSVPNTVSHAAECDVLIVHTVGRSLADLRPGEGAIVLEGGKKIAGYRSESGEVTTLLPKCKHLGCTVGWNPALGTWDCPCHGSRYAAGWQGHPGPCSARPGRGRGLRPRQWARPDARTSSLFGSVQLAAALAPGYRDDLNGLGDALQDNRTGF